ncbi:phosphoadenosine phosphosulfate reductase family protein [uncultured Ruegeria sp.]|uniref:phosphoadenosine phosphosulfate reductase domain-containing protein n=1 Tax=uncultured Ruegeria sp. TaxID=259304 RepID=UPI002635948E|nr:phosphoadenosine phosphosulfate reductase family protein [uncultured Ruegeria sp.]
MIELGQISDLITRGALFVVNHSAGKDSQAMLIAMKDFGIPEEQMLVVHADLGDVEWPGNMDHIRATVGNLPIITAIAKTSFWDMVMRRGMFPSPSQRQCTSDLKRGPIEREVRRYLKSNQHFGGLVVNCMGMRAQESASRAKKTVFNFNKRNSKAGREWYDWLPIHHLSETEVFQMIEDAGQEPHWAYVAGMSRLSCVFCIMASAADLTTAAKLMPALYRRYVALEKRLGFTLSMSRKYLEEITGIVA